jgi:ABC-type branched-subunit amino acid transport system ATPase component
MAATVFTAMKQLCASGMSVLVAEQNLEWVTDFASRTYQLESGVLVS